MVKFKAEELLEMGFTGIPNTLLNDKRLSFRAIGCYCTILHTLNHLGVVESKAFVNDVISIETMKNALRELLSFGWVEIEEKGEDFTYTLNTISSKPNARNKFEAKVAEELEAEKLPVEKITNKEGDINSLMTLLADLSIRKVRRAIVEKLAETYNYKALRHCIGVLQSKYGSMQVSQMNFEMVMTTELELLGNKALLDNEFHKEKKVADEKKSSNSNYYTKSEYVPMINNKATRFNNYHQREYKDGELEELVGWDD